MTEYVKPNIEVRISEKCFERAYYIHMGKFSTTLKGNSRYIDKIIFDKRFLIDTTNTQFPNLLSQSWFLRSNIDINKTDSYLGSKLTNNNSTVVSLIYLNDFFKMDYTNTISPYKFMIITGKSVKELPTITIPDVYQYNVVLTNNTYTRMNDITKLLTLNSNFDSSKWLYLIDCQRITNKYCTYIINFYINQSNDNFNLNDTIVNLHVLDENAHKTDIDFFTNISSTQSIYSDFILNNNLNTSFNKLNGLVSPNPLQHKLHFIGTPYGLTYKDIELFEDDEFEQQKLKNIITEKEKLSILLKNYEDDFDKFIELMNNKVIQNNQDEIIDENKKLFGKNQIDYIDPYIRSYQYKTINEDEELEHIINNNSIKNDLEKTYTYQIK